jgi:hypothetical protein
MANGTVERVVVTVDDQELPNIQTIADSLQAAGMQGINVNPTLGIITGEVSQGKRQTLQGVSGVVAVEPDEEMHAI